MLRSQLNKLWKKGGQGRAHSATGESINDDGDSVLIPEIPEDIVAVVTDFLRHDNQTLKACSVVSSTWSDYARKQLFRDVVVQDDRSTHRFHKFARFVESHPRISRYIRHLELSWQLENMFPEARPHVSRAMVEGIAKHLPNLKAITFRGVLFTGQTSSPNASPSFFIDRIACYDISSTSTLWINMLSLFTFKELHIHLDPNNDNNNVNLNQGSLTGSLYIQFLKLAAVETLSLQRVVVPALAINCLTSLDAALSRRGQIQAIGALVQKSTTTLQHARIDISALRGQEAFVENWHVLNLSSCTALTSLSISLNLGAYTPIRFSILHDILSSNVNPHLRKLSLSMTLYRTNLGSTEEPTIARNVPGEGCAQLESLIVQKYWGLEDLIIDLRDTMNPYVLPQEIWNTVQESMPQLRTRGVLRAHPRFQTFDARVTRA